MHKPTNKEFWALFLGSCAVTLTLYAIIAWQSLKIAPNPFEQMSLGSDVERIVEEMER